MAAQGGYPAQELNARQRKHVYMHSTIFDAGGPTTKSVYHQSQQQDIYDGLKTQLRGRNRTPPDMSLPSPGDLRATQNMGHNVVLPMDAEQHSPAASSYPANGPGMTTPRQEAFGEGESIPVVQAREKSKAIPKEFWQTSVKLEWHDPRNELSRSKDQSFKDRQRMGAQELKLQELSSEIFGKARLTEASTKAPGGELMAETFDPLQMDSRLRHQESRQGGGPPPATRRADFDPSAPAGRARGDIGEEQKSATRRLARNLAGSGHNNLATPVNPELAQDMHESAQQDHCGEMAWEQEDPSNMGRRRQEKNFSDILGVQMGDRAQVRGRREEITGTRTCSFLDSRAEIAARNKEHWRPDHADVDGTEVKEYPNVSSLRKEAETKSNLFGRPKAERPDVPAQAEEVTCNERVCWDTREIMESGSEIARRSRLKEFEDRDGRSAQTRKSEDLSSAQIRVGLNNPLVSQPRVATPQAASNLDRPMTAKDTKLASLQSSIFS